MLKRNTVKMVPSYNLKPVNAITTAIWEK